MRKVNLLLIVTVFMLTGNVFAQLSEPVIVDQLGVDCEWHYYVHNSLGPRIAVDENGAVHVVYRKAWAAEADTGFALFYKNVTTGTMDTIPPQQPEMLIKPSRAFIGGGRGEVPLFIYYGISTYNFQWGDMPLQAMAKVDDAGKVVPLGVQPDKNYYHEPYYALPITMEVDPTGIAHCLLTNVGGEDLGYWNFDGTNFGEIYAMYFVDAVNDVPGKNVPAKFKRNATKGADLAITTDGSTVAVGGLHPWNNIDVTLGSLGGEIWPDSMELALDEGSFFFLFDTTNCETGDNIDHSMAMPATDLQLAYDDNDVLHIVYEAAWFSHYLDTLSDASFAARNDQNVDKWGGWDWMTKYYYLAGDTNAVYYGSGKPKPQILYWNSTMPLLASSTEGHIKIAESVYPLAGQEFKWWRKANIDSGVGLWSNRADCIIDEVDLIVNTDAQEGEPKGAVVWEEMMSEPIEIEQGTEGYYGYYRDILISVTDDFINWTTPINLTNTPNIDDSEVSVYTDIVDGKVHFVYNSDNLPMSDYFLNWTQTYTGTFLSGPTQRANPDDQVNLVYMEYNLNDLPEVPLIYLVNPSFELPGTQKYKNFEEVPGWSTDEICTDSGVEMDPNAPATDGDWTAFQRSSDPAMWQLTNHVLKAGDVLTLMVDGKITWAANKWAIVLYYDDAGTRVVAAADTVDITDDWITYSITLVANDVPEAIGKKIGILFDNVSEGDNWIGLDNVRLYLGIPTGVAQSDNPSNIPQKFALSQNYPNPFNPATQINYSLAKDVKATLKVYDILGREVLTLLDKKQKAGYYTVTLDASKIPSGTYFYRLKAGDHVFSKKMTLLK